ncbi:hypothetical protein [Lachnotalea glycerini]|uniref:RNA polymerase sigma-70 region 4 domain-containing protein n=1 Tax=Lachnotalea glycerini TaxID=1763509 RepID=A0A371JC81_9FIRM|nr:hypothetical protein [Lachnotalea glycerini]RDY30369.1 hypothetical protein CG710_015020 [Lachnotalea glycerini]
MEREQKQELEQKKEYLQSYLPKFSAAKRLEHEIERFQQARINPCIKIDNMNHFNETYDLSSYMTSLDILVSTLIKARYDRIKAYTEIFNRIEFMEDETEKELLKLRYLKGLKWDKICLELGFEWAQIHRIHRKALEHF